MNKNVRPPLVAEDQQTSMDAAWNEWCDQRARAIASEYSDMVADVLGAESGRVHRKQNSRISTMRAELTLLRGDIRALIERLPGKTAGVRPTKKASARHR